LEKELVEALRLLAANTENYILKEHGTPYVDDLKGPVISIVCQGRVAQEYPDKDGEKLLQALVPTGLVRIPTKAATYSNLIAATLPT
jgi:hypothetical protein